MLLVKIGDGIMILCATASGGIMALPIEETTKLWWIFGLGMFSAAGKYLLGLFKEANGFEPVKEYPDEQA